MSSPDRIEELRKAFESAAAYAAYDAYATAAYHAYATAAYDAAAIDAAYYDALAALEAAEKEMTDE